MRKSKPSPGRVCVSVHVPASLLQEFTNDVAATRPPARFRSNRITEPDPVTLKRVFQPVCLDNRAAGFNVKGFADRPRFFFIYQVLFSSVEVITIFDFVFAGFFSGDCD